MALLVPYLGPMVKMGGPPHVHTKALHILQKVVAEVAELLRSVGAEDLEEQEEQELLKAHIPNIIGSPEVIQEEELAAQDQGMEQVV